MSVPVNPDVLMGFYFFPRGGSAQVVRHLCRVLGGSRWAPTLFAGSLGTPADRSNACRFFNGIRCSSLDYSPAQSDWSHGADAMAAPIPMHASYEDKGGVPDRIFFDLDDCAFDRQVASWTRFFAEHATVAPTLVHLHHLTPMHEAVRELWPDVAVITHLHGTELKMLASVGDETSSSVPRRWTREWVERMRRWAAESDRVVVISRQDEQLAQRLLPLDPDRVTTIASGVDTEVFAPRLLHASERLALWKRLLVEHPLGWRPGRPEGSIRYHSDDLSAFTDCDGRPVPVVLFVGRFMRFKGLQLLIEAHHAMQSTAARRSVLVVVGGFPGEWEDEHPYDTVQRLGAEGVFFAGWRDHHDLADILNCSDVFAAPAVDEPFGLVYLEAMASGLPPIATNTGGPLSFINVDPDRPTGWLVPPADVTATSLALAQAVSDSADRIDRGTRASHFVRRQYSWASSADAFIRLYGEVVDERSRSRRLKPEARTSGVA